PHMVWVWVILSLFVLWTPGISLMRHETTPRALWEAIVANAVVWRVCFLARAVRLAANIAVGSEADISECPIDVRFSPNSGQCGALLACPLCANSSHSR